LRTLSWTARNSAGAGRIRATEHLTFVASAVLLGVLDRIAFATHGEE
jgi:hypothetical protein